MNIEMNKQTAIQLLKENIDSEMKLGTKMVVNWDMYLAMEKEQILEARQDGVDVVFKGYSISNEEYYNETYGGDK
jgi:hypothetical protein